MAAIRSATERQIASGLRQALRVEGVDAEAFDLERAAARILSSVLRAPVTPRPGESIVCLVVGLLCHCARCGHEWLVRPQIGATPERPAKCVACGARVWWLPKGKARRGRPPKTESKTETD